MSVQKSTVYIEVYSDKSFVVRGDTRPHRESLKAMGGKWANRLTDKESGEKFGAWLFWTKKRPELDGWVKEGCKTVEASEPGDYGGFSGLRGRGVAGTQNLEARLASMESTLSRLEKMVQVVYNYIINGEVIEEEEEEEQKPKRLLK